MELGISEEELKDTGDTPATPAVDTKEVNYLITLVVKARELLLICAPQFAAGSDGAQTFAAIRDCLPNLRAIAQKAVTSAEPEEAADEGAHN